MNCTHCLNHDSLCLRMKYLEKHIVAFENNCYRRLLRVHLYATHTPNDEIYRRVAEHIGKYDILLEIIKKRTVSWFGHVVRAKGTLTNMILHGNVEMKRSWMRCGGSQITIICCLEKACQSCCPKVLDSQSDSRRRICLYFLMQLLHSHETTIVDRCV